MMVQDEMVEYSDPVEQVFEYWVGRTWSGRGVRPRLTDKRKRLINKAVSEYGVDVCIAAIDGNMLSDFHQGRNGRGKKYNSIELILRDAEKIEGFANAVLDNPESGFLSE